MNTNLDDELFDEPEGEEEFDDFGGLEYGDEEFDDLQRDLNLRQVMKRLKPESGARSKWKEEKPFNPIKSDDLPLEKYLKMKKEKEMKNEGLKSIIRKVLKEQEHENYMFFSNLEQMKRQCEILLNDFEPHMIDEILSGGHDWAADHISEAKNNMDQVFDFLMNEKQKGGFQSHDEMSMIEEGKELTEKEKKNVPTNPSLWSKAKSVAKSKFKVYPSAYANGFAAKWYKQRGGKWRKK